MVLADDAARTNAAPSAARISFFNTAVVLLFVQTDVAVLPSERFNRRTIEGDLLAVCGKMVS
jgi:hypothetical protein